MDPEPWTCTSRTCADRIWRGPGVSVEGSLGETSRMTTSLLGLRTVIYPAPDLEASKAWWTAFLGTLPDFDEPFYVGFNPGGYELGLLPVAEPHDGALVYWGVTDVNAAVANAIELGAAEHAPASDVGDGIVTATVRSPDGAIVGFIQNPHFAAQSTP